MRILKWIGIVVLGIVVLLLVIGGAMYFVGSSRVDASYQVATASLSIPSDSTSLAYGEHLTRIHGCRDCHGADFSGQVFVDAPPFRITASNLTPGEGGIGKTYTENDFDRAIRHGVRPNGRALFIMPSAAFHRMSDADAAALIAYLRTIPAVDNVLPPTEIRAPGRLMAAGLIDADMEVNLAPARSEPPPPAGPTAEYGQYLTSITCAYCHGQDLRGAQPPNPDSPPAPDLIRAGAWTVDQFKHAMRTGMRPAGVPIDQNFMPITFTMEMADHELEAIHAYLATLSASPTI
ncbi:MAG TPA: c-type cytochrome [Rhodothermales bacterium]